MNLVAHAKALVAAGETVALVTVSKTRGSTPREVGAAMLVTRSGIAGSIGGGTLEWHALAAAQRLLDQGASRHVTSHVLGPDLGQCCGGQVELTTVIIDASNHADVGEPNKVRRSLYLFGAGHVGKALILVLAQTEFDIHWVDGRPGAFPAVVPANVSLHAPDDPPRILTQAKRGSLVLVMTHSHGLDLAIVDAALRNPAIAETGLIGSVTKRARFEKRLTEAGVSPPAIARLICPIGIGSIGSKRPEAIAISTAAQMLALDERLKACESPSTETRTSQVS